LIERNELSALLRRWVDQDADEEEVWQWAITARESDKPADALVGDIVDILQALPFDLINTEDAAVMLDALGNPSEETDLAQNLLWNHLDYVDAHSRRVQFASHPFYGPFIDLD
jgi:hypothetical protein